MPQHAFRKQEIDVDRAMAPFVSARPLRDIIVGYVVDRRAFDYFKEIYVRRPLTIYPMVFDRERPLGDLRWWEWYVGIVSHKDCTVTIDVRSWMGPDGPCAVVRQNMPATFLWDLLCEGTWSELMETEITREMGGGPLATDDARLLRNDMIQLIKCRVSWNLAAIDAAAAGASRMARLSR